MRYFLHVCCLIGLVACSGEPATDASTPSSSTPPQPKAADTDKGTDEHFLSDQMRAIEKAKGVEETLRVEAENQRKRIDEATR